MGFRLSHRTTNPIPPLSRTLADCRVPALGNESQDRSIFPPLVRIRGRVTVRFNYEGEVSARARESTNAADAKSQISFLYQWPTPSRKFSSALILQIKTKLKDRR